MSKEVQTKVAAGLVNSIGKMVMAATPFFKEDPGELCTMYMSSAAVGVAAACMNMTKATPGRPPSDDEMQFSCLVLSNALAFSKDGTLVVGWEPVAILKALDQFKLLTGRSFEDKLNVSLLDVINDERTKANASMKGEMSKFMPQ